ncbi:MAG: thiamine pyrophosphate-binding protein [Chitinophagaceae bacterium]|nr:thiamine pyrophosphate-binding protein [Chitinophagaceae bacterium]
MKASDYIAHFLQAQKVTHVFELSGGMITHILDSLYERGSFNIISMHHEQSAAFAADGFARVSGVPGVALATSGPGATNLLTGIGSCYFDSVPAVFITGQVNQHEQKGDLPIRQLGFQETDIVQMAVPVTKAAIQVKDAAQIPSILKQAFETALSGRPGPVLIDIPMNIQRADIDAEVAGIQQVQPVSIASSAVDFDWDDLLKNIAAAKRPLLLAGRGVQSSFSKKSFLEFAENAGIPVITSLLAVDVIPFEHPLRVGFIGAYGNRWANLSIGEADLLIVIGSRLDIRQTGADVKGFKGDKKIYHIDIEAGEINNRVKDCISAVCDIRWFLREVNERFEKIEIASREEWYARIQQLKEEWPDDAELKDIKGINPNIFIHQLSNASTKAGAFIADVGSHQMWTAQSLELSSEQFFITSGGMGAMGFALPAAIGTCFALQKPVTAIIGDGSMQLNIQELQTIFRHQLPIKIVVINNQSLGMIRQFQDSYFDSKHQSTVWGYSAPDFLKVANAYGIDACTVDKEEQLTNALQQLWRQPDQPFLLQVMVDMKTNVYPKIAFGKPITEMEPFFKPNEMEGT